MTDIASHLVDTAAWSRCARVLDQLTPMNARPVRATRRHYLRRMLPYRTHEDRIEGVVFTLTDVSELRRTTDDLRRSEATSRGQAEELDALYRSRPIGLALFDRGSCAASASTRHWPNPRRERRRRSAGRSASACRGWRSR